VIDIYVTIVVGPLGRVARNGRNWEGFSNDPYLSGALAADTVTAFNKRGVMTSLKHYLMNEQETNRVPVDGSSPQIEAVSMNVDDKTIHELYLWCVRMIKKANQKSLFVELTP
jgi:beta-glucosidase